MNYLRPINIILSVLILIVSFVAWFLLFHYLDSQAVGNLMSMIWLTAFLLLLAGIIGFAFLVTDSKIHLLIFNLLWFFPFFVFFGANSYGLVISLVFLIFLLYAHRKIKIAKELSLKFSVGQFLKQGIGTIIFVLFFAVSAAYHFSPNVQNLANEELKVPRNVFDLILPSLGGFLAGQIPGISLTPEKTAGEILNQLFSEQVKQLPKSVSPQLFEKEKQKFLAEQKTAISEQFGIKFKDDQKLSDIFYDFANTKLNQYLGAYKIFIPAILSSSLFLTLLALSVPFKWLATLIVFAIFKIFAYSGIIFITTVKTDKEVLNA